MTPPSPRSLTRAAITALGALAIVTAVGLVPASAHAAKRPPAVTAGSRYLALGDSISFGYRESNAVPAPNYAKPKRIIGFPEDVAKNLGLKLANASCPGETTMSFIDTAKPSNGCEGAYRTAYPLHTSYKSDSQSQLQYAEAYLAKYPDTRLVTLMIGANDGFLCIAQTSDGCQSEFGALQKKITKHVATILNGLRTKAHYTGQLVIVTYYSTDYSNFLDTYESQGLNSAVAAAAKPYDVEYADGFGQFQAAARQAKGNVCAAQLLTQLKPLSGGTCGVHPSLAGQALLAQAVEQSIRK